MKKLILGILLISNIAFSQGTQISGSQIKDGAITNAKVSNTAGIAYTKINFAGAPPTLVSAENPLTFTAPLLRTVDTISLGTIPVNLGGTGLTAVDAGLVPFGTGGAALATNALFKWDDPTTTLSVPFLTVEGLKVTGNTPQAGYILSALDTDGNLTYTDPAALIPIDANHVVLGTGTGIAASQTMTYDEDQGLIINKSWTAPIESAAYLPKNSFSTSGTYDLGVYDIPDINTYGSIITTTINGSSAVLSASANGVLINTAVNKPMVIVRGIEVSNTISKEVTSSYPVIARTFVSAGANINRAFGLYGRVQGNGGAVTNAFSGYFARPVMDTTGTIDSAAVLAIGPPFTLPGSPVYATNQTWLLIGTNTIPAGNWTINSTSTDPSVFAGKVDAPNITGIKTKTTDYTVTPLDHTILVDASGGNVIITLPAASDNLGAIFVIKKIDNTGNTVTIDGDALELIDGSLTVVTGVQWTAITVQSNGTDWFIL